jgi:putative RNA 2'-phosphotransferase
MLTFIHLECILSEQRKKKKMTTKISKLLSLALRHQPDSLGITLDAQGWTPVDILLSKLKKAGHPLTRDELQTLVDTNDKKRFTLSEDGRTIRAAQGHSVDVSLGLEPSTPPDVLFHGTATANLDSIFEKGLLAGGRQQVHLSTDRDTAVKVGTRHGRPVVLTVNAAKMHADGVPFFKADNGVWLTDAVLPAYLAF